MRFSGHFRKRGVNTKPSPSPTGSKHSWQESIPPTMQPQPPIFFCQGQPQSIPLGEGPYEGRILLVFPNWTTQPCRVGESQPGLDNPVTNGRRSREYAVSQPKWPGGGGACPSLAAKDRCGCFVTAYQLPASFGTIRRGLS